jgi:hypothetical protein
MGVECWRRYSSRIVGEEGVNPDWIKIPSHMRLLAEDYSLRGLIRTIYPDH